jgi:hypothetical protein
MDLKFPGKVERLPGSLQERPEKLHIPQGQKKSVIIADGLRLRGALSSACPVVCGRSISGLTVRP